MEPELLVELVTRGGAVGVLAFFVIGFWRQWIVPKAAYEEMREDRDHYRRLAERGTYLAEEASGLSGREVAVYLERLERRLEDVEAGRDGR